MNSDALPDTERVLVVGGGTMGAGIAQTFLENGFAVSLKEVDAAAALAARERIVSGLERRAARNELPADVATLVEMLDVGARFPDRTDVTLAIESVPENEDLKATVLSELATAYPAAVIATNTSALSIDALARRLPDAERFVGLHFFNPVPRSALVEIVRGEQTGDRVTAACHEVVRRIGKESIEVRDSPGFATSRLGIAIGLEAIRMVEERVASVEDIDAGMVKGYRFPIGPLALGDMVGLDVRLAIAERLHAELGERFRPPDLLRRLVVAGRLGTKSGHGFYEWDARGRIRRPADLSF
ncbi:3-hydroxyacyl-CoA dehydrogenase [Acrocarpospora pleiomorpha]|uniref:3-hydroxyacyl-CoA dehydrogenase n=1 Tax=Acrocarpospora pleiomorpha TaxID=90975 RepID=A0A5M3X6J7_9ACTN|nr:3-hydroxyacyl-CoA dehydrogenase family protein [Acrocarpospora pleiomorpha]GES17317.1 3-hydroxyacyl-CoA dehydrogenase [Acrocarpospora pleiomorpha]